MTNPYLQPVASAWARAAGFVLLVAGATLTAILAMGAITLATDAEARRHLTSSTLISALILVALGGICWQAGFRLAFNRPGQRGALFSRTGWSAIGAGLVVMAGLMAYAVLAVRSPNANDVYAIVGLAAFGAWCFVLAWRG